MTAVSKILAGSVMAVALLFGFIALHNALKYLGNSEGNVMLGGLMPIASIGLLISFTGGCILWVLTVIFGADRGLGRSRFHACCASTRKPSFAENRERRGCFTAGNCGLIFTRSVFVLNSDLLRNNPHVKLIARDSRSPIPPRCTELSGRTRIRNNAQGLFDGGRQLDGLHGRLGDL